MTDEQTPVMSACTEDETGENAAADTPPARPVLLGWLGKFLGMSANSPDRHLDELDAAIDAHPEAAVNYMLRGELYSRMGEYELATADFEQALKLAGQQLAQADWGVVAQVVRDRTVYGLQQTRARSQRARHNPDGSGKAAWDAAE
jgi:tetratricopeptide (TPR) repeat protein